MKEVNVTVFGTGTPVLPSGCTCGGVSCSPVSMREDAEDLKKYLVEKFGEIIKFNYVDIQSNEMNDYPDIVLSSVRLPLIVINGEPRFHGGFSMTTISDAVGKLVE
jgi:hypothetical protein